MQLEPIEVMDVTWNFVADEYEVFRDFFIDDLEHGSLFFVMETIEPADTLGFFIRFTRSYAFLDGTYVFSESDNLFTVNAALEVDEEEQEEFPDRHIDSVLADGGTSSASFHDGEILPPGEFTLSSAGFLSGLHFFAVIATPAQDDTGSNSAGFLSGVYLLVVEVLSLPETGADSASFQSGTYTLVVMVDTKTETGADSASFQSGVYTQIGVPTTHEENTSNSASFQSGAYTLA